MRARSVRLFSAALLVVAVVACSGGGASSVPAVPQTVASSASVPQTAASSAPAADFQRVASVLSLTQRADGAIPYTATVVNPYFANIAATGAARTSSDLTAVQQWIAWYVARSRDANPWGIAGAITDYAILPNGTLQSAGSADSVDAYAATFLTLVSTAWQYGNAGLRAYVQNIRPDVERIASAIDAVTDADGLTWALPAYRMKYVMDATEVYAGFNDLALLRLNAYGDVAAGSLHRNAPPRCAPRSWRRSGAMPAARSRLR